MSLIGQPAPLIVIVLVLETAPEWCLADKQRRAQEIRIAKESKWEK
ncbi:hypothetical protein [Mesorhizobium sanjuanii]|nr:hypothetical protein [Mesorhizobium sanjuanii]